MKISKAKKFFVVLITFFVLGAAFKVMVLVEGLTEIRPVNAIPPIAGLILGPLGAIACGLGNLLADTFGTVDWTSSLGIIANFIGAFLPFRLWHLFSEEAPNLHKNKNILLYCVICLISAFTVAWILSFGLNTFFGVWIYEIYVYVFFNNLGFSIGLGLPVLIILTSEDVKIECVEAPKKKMVTQKRWVCLVYTLLMAILFICVFLLGLNPAQSGWLNIVSLLSLGGLGFLIW